jgi:hypothetical protein
MDEMFLASLENGDLVIANSNGETTHIPVTAEQRISLESLGMRSLDDDFE